MISNKIWQIKENDPRIIKKVATQNNLPEILAAILVNRGLINKEKISFFLNAGKDKFYDPFLMKDMDKAINRIIEAKDQNEKITIYGDYDVDGITSTSIIYLFLKELNCNVNYYIPDRVSDGYGINKKAISNLKNEGTNLIISVDTGITAIEECLYAKELGLDIIITDHHECQNKLPEAIAVINPKRKDCTYPFDMLAGVGVTFKLIHAISIKLKVTDIIWKYLELTAIGTISDLVPLQDENRIIVKLAFETINDSWNIGLKALIEAARIKTEKMTAGTIGYQIGPRLNAAGRLGDASRGVELFTTTDRIRAAQIANDLNNENIERQRIEQEILDDVIRIIENNTDIKDKKVFVISSHGWNEGVIGIVASRIVERYYKPVILLNIQDKIAKGSARSVDGFNIFEALNNCSDLFIKYGGHEMAAGMSLKEEDINELSNRLNLYANKKMDDTTLIEKIKVDYKLDISKVNIELIESINEFEPYGIGNPEPNFILSGFVKDLRLIGQAKNHLKFEIFSKGNTLSVLGFNFSHIYNEINSNIPIEIIATLSINEWQQKRTSQLILKDLKINSEYEKIITSTLGNISYLDKLDIKEYTYAIPLRRDFENLYKYLLSLDIQKINKISFIKLLSNFSMKAKDSIKIAICLEVFNELGLIYYKIDNKMLEFEIFKGKKVELNMSKLYNKWTDKK